MTLYRRILLGIVVISSCMVVLAFLSAQSILTNSYRQIEENNATQNILRAVNVLKEDIDSLKVDDLQSIDRQLLPPRYVPQNPDQNITNDNRFTQMSLEAKLDVALLLDRDNNIIFRNAIDANSGETSSIPQFLLASIKSGNPLLAGSNSLTTVKGVVTLPQGLLMTISVPVYPPDGHNTNWGRLIAGRYIDADEIQRISDSTKLDVEMATYDDSQMSDDFQAARVELDTGHSFFIDSGSEAVVSSYTVVDDIYGKPALILRAQMPRLVYQYGRESINSFLAALLLIILLAAGALFLFLERTVLARLTTLNIGLEHMRSANDLTLEVPTSGHDEITSLTGTVKQLLKDYSQTQSQLIDTKNHLEQSILERTAELNVEKARLEQEVGEQKLANQMIAKTRDKALSDLQLKSQLLANVSHDSRTPLTIIGLNAEMLQQGRHGELNSKQNEVLDRILNATRQLMNFISNMLDEAQLKHGKMSFVNVTYEPKLLIEEFVSMLEPFAEAKGIKLKAELDLALPAQIKGDPDRFKQILTNLVENAIKFTDEGCVTIRALRTDSQHWVIQVSDTGRGIPPDAQNRIFEAYWQLNSASKQGTNRGVGLGLSIVKQIVQLMSGSIAVESKLGQGTTFTVTLPVTRDQDTFVAKSISPINI